MPPILHIGGIFLTNPTTTTTTSKPLNIIPIPQIHKIINTIIINNNPPIMMTTTLLTRTHPRTTNKMLITHTRPNH